MSLFSSEGKTLERSSLLEKVVVSLEPQPLRTMNFFSLACVAYLAVSAGPFGIEDAVSAAGPFPTILAILILPFLWGMPQALMTAELSTMMDENGGYVLWVKRGLGDFAGWMNAFNSIFSNFCDLPTYPVLFASYLESNFLHGLTFLQSWLLRLAALVLVYALNARGMGTVTMSSIVFMFIIMGPFLIEPIAARDAIAPGRWLGVADSIDWSTFVSTMLWNYQGWDSLGCIAGEVKDGGKAYPLGISVAMLLITVTYLFPVAVGVCIDATLANWDEGHLADVAQSIAPWIGTWVLVGATLANLGEFLVVMSTSSRALWSMARVKMLPAVIGRSWSSRAVPMVAMTLQAAVCAVLMSFSFSTLVLVDTFFNNVSLLLEVAAFVRLRYREPDAPRPYKVPGGMVGMWAITIPKIIVLVGSLLLMEWRAWVLCVGLNLIFALAYVVWRRFNPSSPNTTRSRVNSIRQRARTLSAEGKWGSVAPVHGVDPPNTGAPKDGVQARKVRHEEYQRVTESEIPSTIDEEDAAVLAEGSVPAPVARA